MTSTIPTLFPSLVALSHPNENVLTNECLGPVSAQLSHKGGGGGALTHRLKDTFAVRFTFTNLPSSDTDTPTYLHQGQNFYYLTGDEGSYLPKW